MLRVSVLMKSLALPLIGAVACALVGCQPAPKRATPPATAQTTSILPTTYGSLPSNEARVQQEVLLYAALYRAAHETNVGDFTRHFLLEPVQENDPPTLAINPAEFRQRVLSALADLNVPFAWVTETWRTPGVDYFPDTSERATRLRIKIFDRNESQATVKGEVGDWTADVGSSRQAVTAIWDGQRWNIHRDRARLVW